MASPRILVVDDEDTIRHVLRRVLERRGCTVLDAGTAEGALEIVADNDPEVALVDIVLPDMNGLKLAQEIRTRHPDCEIVIMTSHASVDTAVEAIRRGAHDYLSKPFPSLDDIWTVVSRALEKRATVSETRELLEKQRLLNDEMSSALTRLTTLVDDRVIRHGSPDEAGEPESGAAAPAPVPAPGDISRG
jgi:DNA-binding NtrC family response regulator